MRRVVILSLAVLMAPVPLASTTLRVWAEPLTFSIYPVRKLRNLKVRCSL